MYQAQTVVLIPARNESATVGYVVEKVINLTGWPVIVIDDASTDGTGFKARQAGATVIRLPRRTGAWRAIQTGIRYSLSNNFQCAITMDADGQHLAETLQHVHGGLNSKTEVAIGSCPSRMSRNRRAGWYFFRVLTGLRVEDLTSGLRAYNQSAMALLCSNQAALLEFQDIGVLMLLRSAGFQITEIPVPMKKRITGRSKIYSSWVSIAYYILKTTLICVQKREATQTES